MTNYDEPTVIEKLLAEKKAKVKTFTVDEVIAMLENLKRRVINSWMDPDDRHFVMEMLQDEIDTLKEKKDV
jgi:hypothetical protein